MNKHYIIDAHCHIYPEKIAAKATASTDRFYDVHYRVNMPSADSLRQALLRSLDLLLSAFAGSPRVLTHSFPLIPTS